jgi:hypothetical protein
VRTLHTTLYLARPLRPDEVPHVRATVATFTLDGTYEETGPGTSRAWLDLLASTPHSIYVPTLDHVATDPEEWVERLQALIDSGTVLRWGGNLPDTALFDVMPDPRFLPFPEGLVAFGVEAATNLGRAAVRAYYQASIA